MATNAAVLDKFERLRAEHQPYYDFVKKKHEENPSKRQRGHGMDHNVHVAMIAIDIALSDYESQTELPELVFLAAIGHSLDRLVGRGEDKKLDRLISESLELIVGVTPTCMTSVRIAIDDHSKKNDVGREDDIVSVILKDADRVANMGAALAIRSGQFYADIPAWEMSHLRTVNPGTTYDNPSSVIEDLRECLVWLDWMRTERGRFLIRIKANNLRMYLDMIAREFEEIGMHRLSI